MDSPYTPYPIPAWSTALQAIDQSPSHLIKAYNGCYAFPDPGLFIHPATAGKYIESWLRVRDIWLMHVAKEPSLALSNQSWGAFLSINNSVLEKKETKASRHRQEAFDIVLPNFDMYPGVVQRSGSMGSTIWHGREYPSGVLPSENVMQEILWELYELNFIHELQSLDRCACQDLDLTSSNHLFDRETDISQCFPTNSFRQVTIPSKNVRFADDDFDACFRFVTDCTSL